MSRCAGCQADLSSQRYPERLPRLAECPACHAQLHACRQCRSWDPDARKCRNPHVDDPPKDAERANFCDFYEMGDPGAPRKDARKALEDLLG